MVLNEQATEEILIKASRGRKQIRLSVVRGASTVIETTLDADSALELGERLFSAAHFAQTGELPDGVETALDLEL